jgi:hypothetical protein
LVRPKSHQRRPKSLVGGGTRSEPCGPKAGELYREPGRSPAIRQRKRVGEEVDWRRNLVGGSRSSPQSPDLAEGGAPPLVAVATALGLHGRRGHPLLGPIVTD